MRKGSWTLVAGLGLVTFCIVWSMMPSETTREVSSRDDKAFHQKDRTVSKLKGYPPQASGSTEGVRLPETRPPVPFPRLSADTLGKGTEDPPTDPVEAEAVHCSNRVDGECSFLHPSQEELVEMARCATIKYDYPPDIMASTPLDLPADVVETGSISAREKEQLVAATDEFRAELRKEFEALLRDMGGSRDELAAMSLEAMQAAITAKEPVEEVLRARRQIARERAGLERPVAPRTPTEKFEAIMAHLGDSYEAKLAKAVGPERAAELRNIRDGWGASTVAGGECDPPDK